MLHRCCQLIWAVSQFQAGDLVRIRSSTVVYKVVAANSNLVTILVSNPQPDGSYLPFTSTSYQTVDESRIEKVAGDS